MVEPSSALDGAGEETTPDPATLYIAPGVTMQPFTTDNWQHAGHWLR